MIGKEAYVELAVDGAPVCWLMVSGDLTGAEAVDLVADVLRDGDYPVAPVPDAQPSLTVAATGAVLQPQVKLQAQDLRDGDTLALAGYSRQGR